MKFGLILLASLPAIFAENAALVPRAELVAEAEQSGCAIPSDFHIKQFETKWDRNGTSIASLKFTYVNSATDSSTSCRFWKHSRPEKRAGGAAHYACTNKEAAFSWQADEKKLTIIQQACPNEKGQFKYEAAGSVFIPRALIARGYKTNSSSSSYQGSFDTFTSSFQPVERRVEHARVVRKRGVAWSYDIYN
ncbi:hypothetical protein AAL_04862 [Moelleriella libera RCEF 2490]|uniref:AA1-like domain-containing protein n=1 Tax=Moelleriella libera RCEF 2490 TaxID=1081109 RepID=A0A168B3S9_9HYPO|nr:hypothetical protein AAL_04862 [Moelleriella libera RCEF 2490]